MMTAMPMSHGLMLGGSPVCIGSDRGSGAAQSDLHSDVDRDHAERRRPGLCRGRRALGATRWPGHVPVHSGDGRGRSLGWPGAAASASIASTTRSTPTPPAGCEVDDARTALAGSGDPLCERSRAGVLRFPRRAVAWIAVGSVAVSAVISLLVPISFLSSPPAPMLTRKSSGRGSTSAASARRSLSISTRCRWS